MTRLAIPSHRCEVTLTSCVVQIVCIDEGILKFMFVTGFDFFDRGYWWHERMYVSIRCYLAVLIVSQ